jgi:hypothetical protein
MGTYEDMGRAYQYQVDMEDKVPPVPPEPEPHEVIREHIARAITLLGKVDDAFCMNRYDEASSCLCSAIQDHLDLIDDIINTEKRKHAN